MTVTGGADTGAINFILAAGSAISGRIYQADGVTPVVGADVWAKQQGGSGNRTESGTDGSFTITGLAPGNYEVWGRMAIVDTKPFKLRVILHRIFVERPQVTGIPAWPGGAACYRRSRYIL